MFYSQLNRGEFRLLKLHAGAPSDALHCSLEVRTLYQPNEQSRAPHPEPYEALSYAWEAREPQQSLSIIQANNSHAQRVYPSLKAALLQLRQPCISRYLWVDALCINQEDKAEKSGQVKEMSRIYNQAQGVCVWLGLERDHSSRAIRFIRDRLQYDDSDSLMADSSLGADWAALYKLITRPWFSRRWIIQEIALARAATVYCGRESIPWDIFANATSFFVSAPTQVRQMCRTSPVFNHDENHFGDLGESAAARLVDLAGHIFNKDDGGGILGRSLSLEELLCSHHMFETSEPRDAVYAILSIAEDARPGFKAQEEADLVYRGNLNLTVSTTHSRSPNTAEHLSPTLAGPFQLRQRSTSLESRAGNGNLSLVSPANYSGHKRAPSRMSISDEMPPTRQKTDHDNQPDVTLTDVEPFPPTGSGPTILVSKTYPDVTLTDVEPFPPTGSGPTILVSKPYPEASRPLRPFEYRRPTTEVSFDGSSELSFDTRGRSGSSSSAGSSRGDAMATEALKRIARSYKNSRIPVDYTKPLYEVCKDVLSFTFRASNSLNMICRPWAPSDPSLPLPSWIPTMSNNAFSLGGDGVYVRVRADPLVGGPRPGQSFYRAAKNAPALWEFGKTEENQPFLTVKGFELDTIRDKTSPAASGIIPGEWNEFVGWTDPRAPPPDPFWKTLVGNRDAVGDRARTFWKTACQRAFHRRAPQGDLNVEKTMRFDARDHVREYLERVLRTVCARRLATLNTIPMSNSLALVPMRAKKGDKVVILYGCSVPVLLRWAEPKLWTTRSMGLAGGNRAVGHYEMVGECYVHGMMDGEALFYKKQRRIEDRYFCLV